MLKTRKDACLRAGRTNALCSYDGTPFWQVSSRVDYALRMLHGPDLSVLQKNEGHSLNLLQLLPVASRAHSLTLEVADCSAKTHTPSNDRRELLAQSQWGPGSMLTL